MKMFIVLFILLIFSINLNSQFINTGGPGGGKVYCLFISNQYLFAGTETGGVYRSSNDGTTWNQIVNGMGAQNINCLIGAGNTIFAGVNSGLYRSLDNGDNWSQINYGASFGVTALTTNNTDLYLGNSNSSVYRSTDNGISWTVFGSSFNIGAINSILFANNIIYVAGVNIAASSNNGLSWNIETTGGSSVKILFQTGNIIRAGTNNGGKKNTNPLGGWIQDIPWSNVILGYAHVGNYLIAGMSTGMFWSSDNGTTWHDPNSFYMMGIYVFSVTQNSQYVFAGTQNGVYRRPSSEINGFSLISSEIPKSFSLLQNYPNPFNPATSIRFNLAGSGNVELKVYNSLGQLLLTLINQKLEPGTYNYDFDSGNLSSGVYYYKLFAGEFSQTRKMILVK